MNFPASISLYSMYGTDHIPLSNNEQNSYLDSKSLAAPWLQWLIQQLAHAQGNIQEASSPNLHLDYWERNVFPIELTEIIEYQPKATDSHLSTIHSFNNSLLKKNYVPHAAVGIRDTEIRHNSIS